MQKGKIIRMKQLIWSATIHCRFRRRELIPVATKAAINRRTPNLRVFIGGFARERLRSMFISNGGDQRRRPTEFLNDKAIFCRPRNVDV